VPAAVLAGIVCVATVAVVALLSPVLRKLDLHDLKTVPEAASTG